MEYLMGKMKVWFRNIQKRYSLINNYCKKCGRYCHPFTVSNELWNLIAENKEDIYCVDCFSDIAEKKQYYFNWIIEPGLEIHYLDILYKERKGDDKNAGT